MVCASEGDTPNDTNHTHLRTMFYFANKLQQPIKEFDAAEREKNLNK